jgi:hypothetical protein
MSSSTPPAASIPSITTPAKKPPYPFYLGGLAATIAASITHPLDLTKVRLQASGDKRMLESMKKTLRTAGARGLFDGITGTWMRQMSYSLCRFWAYDESKKLLGANAQSSPWVLAGAGVMGMLYSIASCRHPPLTEPSSSWFDCWHSRQPRWYVRIPTSPIGVVTLIVFPVRTGSTEVVMVRIPFNHHHHPTHTHPTRASSHVTFRICVKMTSLRPGSFPPCFLCPRAGIPSLPHNRSASKVTLQNHPKNDSTTSTASMHSSG